MSDYFRHSYFFIDILMTFRKYLVTNKRANLKEPKMLRQDYGMSADVNSDGSVDVLDACPVSPALAGSNGVQEVVNPVRDNGLCSLSQAMRNKKDRTCYTNIANEGRKRLRRFLSLTG